MTKTYFPFDVGDVQENQWSKMGTLWLSTGVVKTGDAGVDLNLFEVFADDTGMLVKVKSGKAWIRGHYFESDAQESLAIAAADATNPRIDRVIVEVDWPNNVVDLKVLTGTPGISPSAPALTQNTTKWQISLAQVRVEATVTSIVAGKVTDERPYAWQLLPTLTNLALPGVMMMYAGSVAPSGFLLCDGSAVSRTAYAALFAVLGTTYGAGDGSTTFNLPDFRGRVPMGVGTGAGGGASGSGLPTGGVDLTARARGTWGGEETHVLTTTEMPAHNHTRGTTSNATGTNTSNIARGSATNSGTIQVTDDAGSNGAHNNVQPFMVINFIIKT